MNREVIKLTKQELSFTELAVSGTHAFWSVLHRHDKQNADCAFKKIQQAVFYIVCRNQIEKPHNCPTESSSLAAEPVKSGEYALLLV